MANIKQQFDSMRSQSDVYYANNNDYGTGYAYSSRGDKSGTGSEIWVNDNCVTDSGTGIFRRSTTGLGNLINGICKSGASSIIVAVDTDPATKWAIKVTGPGSNYFCEDSSGVLYFRTTSAYNVLNGVCS
ncbi:MAG: hypothetical protein NTX85_01270 [Candidatus Nomurabacteria bacterium]|nr:hypothetical protein [Candidatus Nomurabacteria bacterium]